MHCTAPIILTSALVIKICQTLATYIADYVLHLK